MPSVRVNLSGASYDIDIRPGLLRDIAGQISRITPSRKLGIVTDSLVGPIYLQEIVEALREAAFTVITAQLPAGEDHKTLASIAALYDQFLPARIDRSTPLIALGGGVIGDMTGFAAATILRGVPFIQIPTTLLSMVDASVGGKTGIDHAVGKNLIGAFHQPIAVLIDPQTLRTLPPRELRSGLAECIKHEIIRDAEGFTSLEKNIHRALALDMNYLADLIAHNVSIKARVVEADPFERDERAHLNFGHTFGHAIETVSNYSYAHGECVALGMVAGSRAAHTMDMLDGSSLQRIINLIASAGLPIGGMTLDPAAVIDAMIYDKKVKAGKIRFILPDRIGHVVIRDDVPELMVRNTVTSLRQ